MPSTSSAPNGRTELCPSDLESVNVISELLLILNDPQASATALSRSIERLPVLRARLAARFATRHPNRRAPSVAEQIALLGNRTLEEVLLIMLEDLVELASRGKP